jgi:hypothetical protein
MFNKIVPPLSLVLALCAASTAMAASKHVTYGRSVTPSAEEQLPRAARGNYCSNPRNAPGFGTEPNYMAIQDEDECESN